MLVAAAGVLVHLVDELGDGRAAVADDLRRLAAGGGDEAVADDQQAVVVAGGVPLDDDAARSRRGRWRRRPATCSRVVRFVATPRPWLPSWGLTTTGGADLLGGGPGVLGVGDGAALGHGHAHRLQERAREVLVLGDRLGDGAGAVGLRRPDPPLRGAVAELDEAASGSSRRVGMPRAWAAATMAAVLGPSPTSWASLRSRACSAFASKGSPEAAARSIATAEARHSRARASSRYGIATRTTPGSDVAAEAPGPTGFQASVWSSRATCHRVAAGQAAHSPGEYRGSAIAGQPGQQAGDESLDRVGPHAVEPTELDPGLEHLPGGPDVRTAEGLDRSQSHSERLRFFDASRPMMIHPARRGPASRIRGGYLRTLVFGRVRLAQVVEATASRFLLGGRLPGQAIPDERQGRLDVVQQDQEHVPRPHIVQGPRDRGLLPMHFPDLRHARAVGQPAAEEIDDLPLGPASHQAASS